MRRCAAVTVLQCAVIRTAISSMRSLSVMEALMKIMTLMRKLSCNDGASLVEEQPLRKPPSKRPCLPES